MKIELFEDDIELVDDIVGRVTKQKYAQYMYDELYSVRERKRNKITFGITIVNSALLLPTIFKIVKFAIAYFSHLF